MQCPEDDDDDNDNDEDDDNDDKDEEEDEDDPLWTVPYWRHYPIFRKRHYQIRNLRPKLLPFSLIATHSSGADFPHLRRHYDVIKL